MVSFIPFISHSVELGFFRVGCILWLSDYHKASPSGLLILSSLQIRYSNETCSANPVVLVGALHFHGVELSSYTSVLFKKWYPCVLLIPADVGIILVNLGVVFN